MRNALPLSALCAACRGRRPGLTSGALVAGAFCLSEPGSGSDAAAMSTTARRDGDDYILNGTKAWITSGAHAGVLISMARTGAADAGHRGISAFLLEPGMAGFSTGKPEDKCGLRGSNTVSVILEDCRVPAANRLGEEGIGFGIAMTALDGGRITIGSMANGIARAAGEQAASYALERKQFGKPIAEFQAIQHKLADMATELEASRKRDAQRMGGPVGPAKPPAPRPVAGPARPESLRRSRL